MQRPFPKAVVWLARFAALLVVILIVFYAEEDWRGSYSWAACQKDMLAKGETLNLRTLAPPGKPEDDLSKVPIFAELYKENGAHHTGRRSDPEPRIREIDPYLHPSPPYAKSAGKLTDLVSWQKYYRTIPNASHITDSNGTPAQDVLTALGQYDSLLSEINTAVSNPNAYWPIDYEHPFWGFLGGISSLGAIRQILELKAVAHLENREPALAEKEFLFSISLGRPSTKEGSFLVNYLTLASITNHSEEIISEGLHRQSWNDAQLREMEATLASMDMLPLAVQSIRCERAGLIQTMKIEEEMNADVVGNTGWYSPYYYALALFRLPLSQLRPSGWWDQDRANLCREVQSYLNAINVDRGTLDPSRFPRDPMCYRTDRDQSNTISTWRAIFTPVSSLAVYGFDNLGFDIAKAETYNRLARLGCRLEVYRLAKGEYPSTLDELPDLPAHLDQEVLSGTPLRYQRKGDSYQLYSLGWSQHDNGGIPTADGMQSDWVWTGP